MEEALTKQSKNCNFQRHSKNFKCYWFILTFWVLLLSIFIAMSEYFEGFKICQKSPLKIQKHPIFWINHGNSKPETFNEVIQVLNRLGLSQQKGKEIGEKWDLFWSEEIPFKLVENLDALQPHQKVNHIPGIECLVHKYEMITKTDLEYIPEVFIDAESFEKFAKRNPESKFLQKHKYNRGVSLKEADQVSFDDENFFIQEFVGNLLLIDGHFFEFGVYVVITSVDPLRIYIYQDDIMLRFCPEKYHPFNASNLDQYVISDSMAFAWDIPSINKFYKHKYSAKSSLKAYLESQGFDNAEIWKEIDECILNVVLQNEQFLVAEAKKYQQKHNFFEMVRFDFILDENLMLHLLKIKLSPSLHAEGKSAPLKNLYEKIAYNLFNLVGIGSHLSGRTSLKVRNYKEHLMISSPQNTAINASLCQTCDDVSCERLECEICFQSMKWQDKYELEITYQEQMNSGNFKRLFPVASDDQEYLESLSDNNRKHAKWISAKCYEDAFWC